MDHLRPGVLPCAASRSLVCRRLVAERDFALSALVPLSLSGLARRGHSTPCALAQLVDFCFFGRLASSLSDAMTHDLLTAIVRYRAGPICRACSIFSMLLAQLGSVGAMPPFLPTPDIGLRRTASPRMALCAGRDLLECPIGSWTALFLVAVRSGAATRCTAICAAHACQRRCCRMRQG